MHSFALKHSASRSSTSSAFISTVVAGRDDSPAHIITCFAHGRASRGLFIVEAVPRVRFHLPLASASADPDTGEELGARSGATCAPAPAGAWSRGGGVLGLAAAASAPLAAGWAMPSSSTAAGSVSAIIVSSSSVLELTARAGAPPRSERGAACAPPPLPPPPPLRASARSCSRSSICTSSCSR
jgi:hypothetical protein